MTDPIRLRVGASADASLSTVFVTFVEAAKKARAQVEAEIGKLGGTIHVKVKQGTDAAVAATAALPAGVKKNTDAAEKEFAKLAKQSEKWRQDMVRAAERAMRDEVRATEKAAQDAARAHEKGEKEKTRATEREAAARSRSFTKSAREMQAASQKADRQHAQMAKQGVSVAARSGRMALSHGAQFAGDLVGGIGVQTNVGSLFGSGVDLEKRAVDLTNAAYMPGQAGANGQRQDPSKLISEIRATSDATAMDPTKSMDGLQAFVGKTGDLETGRAVLKDMAMLSRATGASMEDMVNAAGDVSNALGETDNKAEKIKDVMRAFAGQGKEGAVEIKDLASQMAKLSGASTSFSGDHAHVMKNMGALAQMARAEGGAPNAATATTDVVAFANTFDKGAREKAFKKFGVKTRDATGLVRDDKDVILESIAAASSASHGGMGKFKENMGQMFADTRARGATRGAESVFLQAGGGEAGLEAARKAIEKYENSTMDAQQIQESFARSMNTTEAKVQVFNNTMTTTADEVRANLMPALMDLAPAAIGAAKGLSELFSHLPGSTSGDNANRKADRDAKADETDLRRGIMAGKVGAGTVEHAEEDVKDLNAKIAAQKKMVDGEKPGGFSQGLLRAVDYTPFGAAANKLGITGTKEGVGSGLANAREDKLREDQRLLTSMETQATHTQDLLSLIRTGTLRVEIVKDATKPASGLPKGNPGAVSPEAPVPGEN